MVRRWIFPVTSGFPLQWQLHKRWQVHMVQIFWAITLDKDLFTRRSSSLAPRSNILTRLNTVFTKTMGSNFPHWSKRWFHPPMARTWRSWLKSSKRCGDLTRILPRSWWVDHGGPSGPRCRASTWSASMWPMAIPRLRREGSEGWNFPRCRLPGLTRYGLWDGHFSTTNIHKSSDLGRFSGWNRDI